MSTLLSDEANLEEVEETFRKLVGESKTWTLEKQQREKLQRERVAKGSQVKKRTKRRK